MQGSNITPVERKNLKYDYMPVVFLLVFFIGGIFFKLEFWKKAEPMTLGDLYFYQGLAQAFLAGDWAHFWHFHFYPAYPILMAAWQSIFGSDLVHAARWLNLVFDGLSAIPIYLLGREIFNKRVGIFSAMFWSFCWPYHRVYGDPEPVYAFFIFIALFLVLKKHPSWKGFVSAIALASFAGLIKSEATFFVLLICLIYAVRGMDRFRNKVLLLGAAAVIYLVFTSPIWIKYYQATGEFNPNPKSRTLFFVHNPPKEYQLYLYGIREDKEGFYTIGQRIYIEGDKGAIKTSLRGFVRDNPKLIIDNFLGKLGTGMGPMQLTLLARIFPGTFILFLFYIVRRSRAFNFKTEAWLWAWALLFNIAAAVFSVWERFFYPYMPILILFSAKGLDRMVDLSEALHRRLFPESHYAHVQRIVKWAPAAFFIFWFFLYNFLGTLHFEAEQPTANNMKVKADLAEQFKQVVGKNTVVMCRGFPEPFTYFLGVPFWRMVITPSAEPEEIVRYAEQKNIQYLFVEEEDLKRIPGMKPWLWGEVKNDSVELIQSVPQKLKNEYYPYAWYAFIKRGPK